MRLHYCVPASLVLFATASVVLPGCTITEQSTCEGDSCTGSSPAVGGSTATGGSSSRAGATVSGGASELGGTSANQAPPTIGGNTGTATGGTTAANTTRTGGTSSIVEPRTGGASSNGGTSARVGGATSTGGASARVGGATSTGGASARTGGATSTGGASARTGGTRSVGGSSSAAGSPSTGGSSGGNDLCPSDPNKTAPGACGCGVADTDTDGDSVADCNDICPSNPQLSKAGKITFAVVFGTGAQAYPEYQEGLRRSMIAAGNDWAKRFPVPHDVSIEVQIDITDIPTANGKSADSVYVESLGGMSIYQQSAAYEILTSQDPNGADPDIEINFGIAPLTGANGHFYWFDPDPVARTATMPSDGVDAVSTCLHELGHALGFNGWRDWETGELPSTYCSYYDYLSSTDGTDFFFDGTRAVAKYGSPVPETYGNIAHIGNLSPRPGQDLDLDLMRGTRTLLAHRYYISDVDLAIMADIGLPVPGTTAARDMCDTSLREPGVIELGPRPTVVD